MDLVRFGRVVRALRHRRGLRQDDVAAAAGVSRSQVGRVERGQSGLIPVRTLDRIAAAVGGSTDLVVRWQGEGVDRLLDEDHAALVESVVRLLRGLGWETLVEVSFSVYGERGAVDVIGWHPGRRALVIVEVKSVVADFQGTLSVLDRKVRLAAGLVRDRGWAPRVVGRLLVVEDTATNRRRLANHAATIDAALPASGWTTRRWLADPVDARFAGRLFLAAARGATAIRRSRRRVRRPRPGPSGGTGGGAVNGPPDERSHGT